MRDYEDVINGRYVYALEAFVAELSNPGSALKPTSKKLSEIMSEFWNLVKIDLIEARCYDPNKECWDHRLSREFSEKLQLAIELVRSLECGSDCKEQAQMALDDAYSRLKEMSRHFFFYHKLQARKRI
ncbi:hypothetical protein KY329_01640 [Candidatus Woesearchaeota archaeon]|nr:hypothetical protein [Candidatus Woesearchaeota archaeon]